MSGILRGRTVCDPGWIQGGWVYDRPSCGKPPVDLKLELMCYTAGRRLNSTDDERYPSTAGSLGIDFGDRGDKAFTSCCSPPDAIEQHFLYQKEKNCGGMNFCYTSNPLAANNWTYCVHQAANKLMNEFRAEGLLQFNYTAEEALEAECEVVYYDWLRYPMKVKEPDRKKCVTSGVVQTRIAMVPLLLSAMLAVAVTL
ncbi:hypothetical protein PGQ11_001654 [Apiospora arundinis]|uniref:Uncharacterized protein n=1 Tax=Apiospora arundinis TaxID=335852 RepID=A0ABR2JGE2_9PEZI